MSKRSKLGKEWAEVAMICAVFGGSFCIGLLIRFRWFWLALTALILAWSVV